MKRWLRASSKRMHTHRKSCEYPTSKFSFVAAYNHSPKPFAWTKSEVHQKRLKPRFADQ
jgi:hypothetical protein